MLIREDLLEDELLAKHISDTTVFDFIECCLIFINFAIYLTFLCWKVHASCRKYQTKREEAKEAKNMGYVAKFLAEKGRRASATIFKSSQSNQTSASATAASPAPLVHQALHSPSQLSVQGPAHLPASNSANANTINQAYLGGEIGP